MPKVRLCPLQAGKIRMDAFLAARLPETSRSRLKDCIRDGKVHVNSARQIKAAYALRLGDAVTCELPTPRVSSASPEDIPLDIVHEDDSVIVVNKPAGATGCSAVRLCVRARLYKSKPFW